MCINLETSVISFILGVNYGWKLFQTNVKQYQVIGLFAICISLIQLVEACIYFFGTKWYIILNKILLICLGLQGFFIFHTHKTIFNQQHYLYFVTLIILVVIICKTLSEDFVIEKTKCLDWNFLKHNVLIRKSLFCMYICILVLLSTNKIYSKYRNYLLFTYFISEYCIINNNKPSMWCLTSALITPIFYYNIF